MLKTILSISGKPGLYKLISQGVQGKRRFLPPYFVGLQQIN